MRREHQMLQPINLLKTIKNFPLLPPVANKVMQQDQLMIMMVGGPNARKDYHTNPTNEWFYQFKGSMILKVIENNEFKDIEIKEGESLLLPSNIPHCPTRVANTLGLVVEMIRPKDSLDSLIWFCEGCQHKIYSASLHVTDLNKDLIKPIQDFNSKTTTCPKCNKIHNAQ